MFEWLTNPIYQDMLIEGYIHTLQVAGIALLLGFVIGFPASIVEVFGGRISKTIISGYVEIFRGTPLTVQLFILYFGLRGASGLIEQYPFLAFDTFTAMCLALGLNSSAYQEGYIKGAIEGVAGTQMEAARSLGMTKLQGIIYIVIPQAVRTMIPGWSNEATYLPKMTSLGLLIGFFDFLSAGWAIAHFTYRILEVYIFVAIGYVITIFAIAEVLNIIYERVKIPG
ncbi:MAG: ABC transporter permease subunit [Candidatus Lokiarchaeota archaeon]|nr:ABC transporter permease subunit [Candidatus Lokiarchaeota archaeon]